MAAGIWYISDILDDNQTVLNYDELLTKYGNCMAWLEYRVVIESIPQVWLIFIWNVRTNETMVPPDIF